VTSLRDVLSNKQTRGAFGQGRMESIIQDGLPKGAYEFQYTLKNGKRPDCVVLLPDQRPLVIDAKFPLEAVTAFRDGKTEDERKFAAQRVRQDVMKHINDIAEKYSVPRRDPGHGADVRAVGVGLCRACTTASTTSCRRPIAPR
jgi:DNA recombination protein RmuC